MPQIIYVLIFCAVKWTTFTSRVWNVVTLKWFMTTGRTEKVPRSNRLLTKLTSYLLHVCFWRRTTSWFRGWCVIRLMEWVGCTRWKITDDGAMPLWLRNILPNEWRSLVAFLMSTLWPITTRLISYLKNWASVDLFHLFTFTLRAPVLPIKHNDGLFVTWKLNLGTWRCNLTFSVLVIFCANLRNKW